MAEEADPTDVVPPPSAEPENAELKTTVFKLFLKTGHLNIRYKDKYDLYESLKNKAAIIGIALEGIYYRDKDHNVIPLSNADAVMAACQLGAELFAPIEYIGAPRRPLGHAAALLLLRAAAQGAVGHHRVVTITAARLIAVMEDASTTRLTTTTTVADTTGRQPLRLAVDSSVMGTKDILDTDTMD
ncbi:unnamed protein product, partial [Heligmosomoides polygyrus]|uniref:FERM domain-containing protein n=1 Tax=Heligmosomoides polygyrus TaxID=6339 RepID=A0A183F502_HELPZ